MSSRCAASFLSNALAAAAATTSASSSYAVRQRLFFSSSLLEDRIAVLLLASETRTRNFSTNHHSNQHHHHAQQRRNAPTKPSSNRFLNGKQTRNNASGGGLSQQWSDLMTQVADLERSAQVIPTPLFQLCYEAIESMAKDGTQEGALLAEDLLEKMAAAAERGHHPLTARPYIHVIRAWAERARVEAERNNSTHDTKEDESVDSTAPCPLDRAFAVYERMKDRAQSKSHCHPSLNHHVHSALMYVCGQSSHPEARHRADKLLRGLEHDAFHADPPTFLPSFLYHQVILIHAFHAPTSYGAAAAAEDWLLHLSELATQGGAELSTEAFNRVLRAWAESPEDNSLQRAMEILNLMLTVSRQHAEVKPNAWSFGTVISAHAKRQQLQTAQSVLDLAINYVVSQQESCAFDDDHNSGAHKEATSTPRTDHLASEAETHWIDLTQCFNAVLLAWARSKSPQAGEAVETVWQMVEEQLRESAPESRNSWSHLPPLIVPNTKSYLHRIAAHLAAASTIKERQDATVRVDAILRSMIEMAGTILENPRSATKTREPSALPIPSYPVFSVVVDAWCKRAVERKHVGSADRATQLLRELLHWDHTLRRERLTGDSHDFYRLKPMAFSDCLQAWIRLGQLERALEVLSMAEMAGVSHPYMYVCAINAVRDQANTAASAFLALRLLRGMEGCLDRDRSPLQRQHMGIYTTVLKKLAAVGTLEAAREGLQVLQEMPSSGYRAVRPSTRMYTTVLSAFAKLAGRADNAEREEAIHKAEALFTEMKVLDQDPRSLLKLDVIAYREFLEMFVRWKNPQSGQRAVGIVEEMLHDQRPELEPDNRCYDACIEAILQYRSPERTQESIQFIDMIQSKVANGELKNTPSERGFAELLAVAQGLNMENEAGKIRKLALQCGINSPP